MKKMFISVLAAGCTLFAAGALAQMSGQSSPGQIQQDEQRLRQAEQEAQQEAQKQQIQQQQTGQQQRPPQQGRLQPMAQDQQYARQVMAPDKFKELKVQDAQGNDLGEVKEVVLDAKEGRIGYIVVESGGVLGGGQRSVIPWSAVKFKEPMQGAQEQGQSEQKSGEEPVLILNASKDHLLAAPEGDLQESLDRKYAELIHEYYGVTPYWEESQGQQPGQQQGIKTQGQPAQPPQPTPQQPMQQPSTTTPQPSPGQR